VRETSNRDLDKVNLTRTTRRRLIRNAGAAAALLSMADVLAACGVIGGPVGGTKGGTLVEMNPAGIANLNPLFAGREQAGAAVGSLMFDRLYSSTISGEPIPLLAADLPSASPDLKTITVKLRQNLKWSDGKPLTADDVVFTYKVFSSPDYKETNTGQFATLSERIESVTATDPTTIVFKLKTVWPLLFTNYNWFGIVPKHILGGLSPAALNTAEFNTKPTVTSGVFRFVTFDPGQQVKVERNPGYYSGDALLDGYVFRQVANSSAVINGLQTGEAQFGPLDPSLLDKVKSLADVKVYSYVKSAIDILFFQMNPAKPGSKFFKDVRVREALLRALDREQMIKGIYFDQAIVGTSLIPSANWAFAKTGLPEYKYDRAKAEQLLDAAGWTRSGSGVRMKDGQPFEVEMIAVSGQAPYTDLVASMQDQWRQIGVTMKPRQMDFNALVDQWATKRDFDLLFVGVNIPADPDQSGIWSSTAALNGSSYKNDKVDDLLRRGAELLDKSERTKIYTELQQILMTDLPGAPLFYPKEVLGLSSKVKGIEGTLGVFNRFQRSWMRGVSVL
jgi:peptide/nickel transport system substrate-binding protein